MKGNMTILKADGTSAVKLFFNTPIKLADMQKVVAGLIEFVPEFNTFEGVECVAICNEEGQINNLPFNAVATAAWKKCLGDAPLRYEPQLFGDVAIISGDEAFMSGL